jgi:hypothetical protein
MRNKGVPAAMSLPSAKRRFSTTPSTRARTWALRIAIRRPGRSWVRVAAPVATISTSTSGGGGAAPGPAAGPAPGFLSPSPQAASSANMTKARYRFIACSGCDSGTLCRRAAKAEVFHGANKKGSRGFLGLLLGVEGLGFVEVLAADRGVGQHGHQVGLHFEHAAGDEDELFLPSCVLTRTAPGLMRVISGMWPGMMPSSPASPGRTTNSARPGEDRFFRADDVDMNRHCHTFPYFPSLSPSPLPLAGRGGRAVTAGSWPSRRLRRWCRPCRRPARQGCRTRRSRSS